MKREMVKTKISGITDEQLDWLMDENGQDINREKEKMTALQNQVNGLSIQLKTAKEDLKAFDGVDINDLKGQIQKLQGDLQAQAETFAFDAALDGAIRDARGRDVKAVRGMLDIDALKASKDRVNDIKTALKNLTKEKSWAFDSADQNSESGIVVNTGDEHGQGGGTDGGDGVAAAFAALNPGIKL